jgi:hypothetical protein
MESRINNFTPGEGDLAWTICLCCDGILPFAYSSMMAFPSLGGKYLS